MVDLLRFDSIRFDSIRFDSIRLADLQGDRWKVRWVAAHCLNDELEQLIDKLIKSFHQLVASIQLDQQTVASGRLLQWFMNEAQHQPSA